MCLFLVNFIILFTTKLSKYSTFSFQHSHAVQCNEFLLILTYEDLLYIPQPSFILDRLFLE